MVEFPEPSNPSHQAAEQPSLKQGLAALQRKNYGEAIAHLKPLSSDGDRTVQARAQMGLVQAYGAQGQWAEAIALCTLLAQSSEPSVRQWAEAMQQRLQASNPSLRRSGSATHHSSRKRPAARQDEDLAASLTTRRPTPTSITLPKTQRSNQVPSEPPPTPPSQPVSASNVAKPGAIAPEDTRSYPVTTSQAEDSLLSFSEPPAATPASGIWPAVPWTQAGRAEKGRSLGAPDRAKLITVEIITIGLLVGISWAIAQLVLFGYNAIVIRITLPFLNLSRWALFVQPLGWVGGTVGLGLLIAPWIWFWHLRWSAGVRPFTLKAVEARSPETAHLIQRFFRKYRIKIKTQYWPTTIPLVFSYGHWPGPRRIVLSEGLFQQLNDDEIAVLVAGELTHFRFWDGAVLSSVAALLQLPYWLYQGAAEWGDRRNSLIFRIPSILFSVLGYCFFWTGRLAGLWLSRMRLYYSDRAACELTGNPNGLTRALLKLAIAKAYIVWEQEETPYLLERLDLLSPVGRQESLVLGSLYPHHPGTALLEWGRCNPHRRWLDLLDAHPPLGDRLHRLTLVAQKWRLPSELEFAALPGRPRGTWQRYLPLLIQAAPLIGLVIGLLVGQGLWWFGIYAERLRSVSLDWLRNDFIHLVSMSIGFGIGTFLRLNAFFPEVKRINNLPPGELSELLRPPDAMPAHKHPLRLQGKLIGRRGIANAIAQDLFLKTDQGLLRLHFLPFLSLSDNPIAEWRQLQQFLHKTILVSGWFRRGVTPWLDLNSLHTQNGKALRGGHPLWAVAIASIAVLWGCYRIVTGDL